MVGNAAEAVLSVIESGRGSRPYSLSNQETEQVLNIALALLVELAASNDRIDRLERQLAELKGVALDEVLSGASDENAQAERQASMEAMQLRVLRVLMDTREAADGHPDAR